MELLLNFLKDNSKVYKEYIRENIIRERGIKDISNISVRSRKKPLYKYSSFIRVSSY